MTYRQVNPDPDAEPLQCSDSELAQAGFSVGHYDDMPEVDSEFVPPDDSSPASEMDEVLAILDLQDPRECARAMRALERESDKESRS
jgi:hypothetical protein